MADIPNKTVNDLSVPLKLSIEEKLNQFGIEKWTVNNKRNGIYIQFGNIDFKNLPLNYDMKTYQYKRVGNTY